MGLGIQRTPPRRALQPESMGGCEQAADTTIPEMV